MSAHEQQLFLYRLYHIEGKSPQTISDETGTPLATVKWRLKRFRIPLRPKGNKTKLTSNFLADRKWLYGEYVIKNRNKEEIGRSFGMRGASVDYWLAKHSIPVIPLVGKRHFGWKGKKHVNCLGCGKQMSGYSTRRSGKCLKCSAKDRRGENNPCWLPPELRKTDESKLVRKRVEFREWRESVFKRDNWTCRKCQARGGSLHPHHLDGFHWCKERRFDVTNGATLCDKCHDEFHKSFGQRNNTELQFIQFMEPVLKVN